MSLNEHKANINIKPVVMNVIKKTGKALTNYFKSKKMFPYSIETPTGGIVSHLRYGEIVSMYRADKQEYHMIRKVESKGYVSYVDLITGKEISKEEFTSIRNNSKDVNIREYLDPEDIRYARILPTIDVKSLKEKIEGALKENIALKELRA